MVTFYDKCYGWYKSMLIRSKPHPQTESRIRIAAALTEEGAVYDVVAQLVTAEEQEKPELLRKVCESLCIAKSAN